MAERPGVMFYFDLEPALKMLSNEEAGQLFKASMEYVHYGLAPEFDGLVAMAWSFVRPKLDRDGEQYKNKILQQSWKGYISRIKDESERPSFDEWYENIYKPQSATANNGQPSQPTITTTITPTTKASSSGTTTITSRGSKGGGALRLLPESESGVTNGKRNQRLDEINAIISSGLGSG